MVTRSTASLVLRVDAVFNGLAGLILFFFYKPLIALILFPDTNTPLYANVLGAALIGLSLDVWFAANDPDRLREPIVAGIITRLLVAPAILYWLFIGGIALPPVWLGVLAVLAQVALIGGEALYLVSSREAAR